jgi:NAD-dependent oxidoreductase involved in siderophore biosynthesis
MTQYSSVRFAWVILFAFIMCVLAAGLVYWQLVSQSPPQLSPERSLLVREVPQGGTLVIHNGYIDTDECSSVIYREVVDAGGTVIWSESEFRPAVRIRTPPRLRSIPIPNDAAVGKARYIAVVEWACNVVQKLWPTTIVLPELDFEITAKR